MKPHEYILLLLCLSLKRYPGIVSNPLKNVEFWYMDPFFAEVVRNPFLVLTMRYLEYFLAVEDVKTFSLFYFLLQEYLLREPVIQNSIAPLQHTFGASRPNYFPHTSASIYSLQTMQAAGSSSSSPSFEFPHSHWLHAIYILIYFHSCVKERTQISSLLRAREFQGHLYRLFDLMLSHWTQLNSGRCNLFEIGRVWLYAIRPWDTYETEKIGKALRLNREILEQSFREK